MTDKCKNALTEAGVSVKTLPNGMELDAVSQLKLAAASVTFLDGTVSPTLFRDAYSGRPDLQQSANQTQTIGQAFAASPTMKAMSDLLGNRVWIRPDYFDSIGNAYAVAVVMHELLHNFTGLTDPDIQKQFPPGRTGSNDISIALFSNCLP